MRVAALVALGLAVLAGVAAIVYFADKWTNATPAGSRAVTKAAPADRVEGAPGPDNTITGKGPSRPGEIER